MVLPNITFGLGERRIHPNGVSIARYPAGEILTWIKEQHSVRDESGNKPVRVLFERDTISVTIKRNSQKNKVFLKSCKCVHCNRIGNMMSVTADSGNGGKHHFDLFCMEKNGVVLMTKDHIIPKSKKGRNKMSNYQTMCEPCNTKKGDTVESKRSKRRRKRREKAREINHQSSFYNVRAGLYMHSSG